MALYYHSIQWISFMKSALKRIVRFVLFIFSEYRNLIWLVLMDRKFSCLLISDWMLFNLSHNVYVSLSKNSYKIASVWWQMKTVEPIKIYEHKQQELFVSGFDVFYVTYGMSHTATCDRIWDSHPGIGGQISFMNSFLFTHGSSKCIANCLTLFEILLWFWYIQTYL